ncbi:54S ribosomal protein L23, mitochondrial [Rhizophlyctis rosea]|uniref:54S ribosomal protein L23, mitochondrial n=1 Tax=Rhizophlyctis rosea TaxID=64517 RepID=A0AAD5X551_9FUNG|nr:54S ribosomal protein L23, mitochondrial [Rhizophlyctis rosea]
MSGKGALAYAKLWHHVDARDKYLTPLAQRIAIALRGKYKPIYDRNIDCGDFVVVTNARHVAVTDKQSKELSYTWTSKYPGYKKTLSFHQFLREHPTGPIRKEVWSYLPRDKTRHKLMKRLHVFADEDHPYTANIYRNYEKMGRERFEADQQQSLQAESKADETNTPTKA